MGVSLSGFLSSLLVWLMVFLLARETAEPSVPPVGDRSRNMSDLWKLGFSTSSPPSWFQNVTTHMFITQMFVYKLIISSIYKIRRRILRNNQQILINVSAFRAFQSKPIVDICAKKYINLITMFMFLNLFIKQYANFRDLNFKCSAYMFKQIQKIRMRCAGGDHTNLMYVFKVV